MNQNCVKIETEVEEKVTERDVIQYLLNVSYQDLVSIIRLASCEAARQAKEDLTRPDARLHCDTESAIKAIEIYDIANSTRFHRIL